MGGTAWVLHPAEAPELYVGMDDTSWACDDLAMSA